jgi:DNA-binding IclR family transcriptional regulator
VSARASADNEATIDLVDGPLRRDAGPGYVLRTLVALDLLSHHPASPEELAAALGVHRRTARRLIDVMSGEGWVEPDLDDPRRVRLSTRIISVAGEVLQRSDLVQTGASYVRRLRDQLHESSHMSVPTDGWAVHVVEVPSTQPLNVAAKVGARVPIYASAVGKAMAAWLPEQLELAIQRGLERFTPNTLTTRESLAGEMAQTRDRGYAVDDAELYPDTRCIAAPVWTGFGTVVAALGISGPAIRITRDRVESYAVAVTTAAGQLSAALGYQPAQANAEDAQRRLSRLNSRGAPPTLPSRSASVRLRTGPASRRSAPRRG